MQCLLDMGDNSSSGAQLSLVPRPSPAPVFDRLQYAKTEIKNWSRGRPGNEASTACIRSLVQ